MKRTTTIIIASLFSLTLVSACKKPQKKEAPADKKEVVAKAPAKEEVKKAPASAPAAKAPADPKVARAQALVKSLKMKLGGELKAAMKAGGFEKAVEICKMKAPEITDGLSKEGIEVGRATHKPRNAKNAANDWQKEIIAFYQGKKATEAKPFLTKTIKDAFVYAEPIYMQGLCLSCHGDKKAIPPKVAELIKKRYPEDKALDFKEGDLRGIFWVTIPAKKVEVKKEEVKK